MARTKEVTADAQCCPGTNDGRTPSPPSVRRIYHPSRATDGGVWRVAELWASTARPSAERPVRTK